MNKRIPWWLVIIIVLFMICKPVYTIASEQKIEGNVCGMEEKLILMKQDFLYLEGEIERLRKECE